GALSAESIALRRAIAGDAGFPPAAEGAEELPARALDVVERVFFLRRNSALRLGRIDAMTALAQSATEIRAPAGERLWRAGDPSGSMIAIVGGEIAAATPEGQRFTLGPSDMAGSLDTLARQPRWYEATVTRPLTA